MRPILLSIFLSLFFTLPLAAQTNNVKSIQCHDNKLGNLSEQSLELKGAKVTTEAQAKELVFKQYISQMLKSRGVSATESPQLASIETLGFDMPGYAKKGDIIWEVRVIDLVSGLNAIAWVHSETQAIKFLLLPSPGTID